MEDHHDPDRLKDVLTAAMSLVLSDNVYGPNDPRTRQKVEHLAQRLDALTSRDREVEPSPLRVIQGGADEREPPPRHGGDAPTTLEHQLDTLQRRISESRDEGDEGFQAPPRDDRRWSSVKAFLVAECQLPVPWIDDLYQRGKLYADEYRHAVFLRDDGHGVPSGACVQGTWQERAYMGLAPGTQEEGWFSARLPGADDAPPTLILAQSPIEALSCLEMRSRGDRDRTDGRHRGGPVTVISMDVGEGWVTEIPHEAIRATLARDGLVRVAVDQGIIGERLWAQVNEPYPQADRAVSGQQHWNAMLRYTHLCRSDPEAAARWANEMQRQNPPSAQSRQATRDAVRHLAPDRSRGRDGWER